MDKLPPLDPREEERKDKLLGYVVALAFLAMLLVVAVGSAPA